MALWFVFPRWYEESGSMECDHFETQIVVYEKFHTEQLYENLSEQTDIVPLECPVSQDVGETIAWYKVTVYLYFL